ncbi:hypothetical protein JM946_13915 [Steroidobacter sp. S1-65]|uniref:Wadjet protein JetD C-terminal domain-containing protein n=1 Tax=Steroidobacter gossypii TaxID=2805490 RepID=A0ABS1WXX4_9GAMM|nr:Wadjet anti-phage system protein JetD domain-containing protein [Steroidobacter gossypii]MBM0105832.1 hypothetical protein [Steroidobacter gossypii]
MKSPADLARRWAKQWGVADTREERLLAPDAWPVALSIGKPTPTQFTHHTQEVRNHLQRWRAVSIGHVRWEPVSFRSGSDPVEVPVTWELRMPSEWIAACADSGIQQEYERLGRLVSASDSAFHRLLVRRRHLLLDTPEAEIIKAMQVAMHLFPSCAEGRPLRALSICGSDSKFFERNRSLLIHLLDVRFEGQVSDLGLEVFLDALDEGEHWVLVAPLEPDLLPFAQQRVRARELTARALPGTHVLLVENDRCLHQLPALSGTVAVLGAGLNLNWLGAPWLTNKRIGYWGDIDTWGLVMLAKAREQQSHLEALLMDRKLFDALEVTLAVVERRPAGAQPSQGLTDAEIELYRYLQGRERGRLEQEFVPRERVIAAIEQWRAR